ncbi:hypothetical protein CAEBREN_28848 [Caenorhabditis brenneri]|uniref:DUF7154 domain-containing protein n=1 Tax=Caenorhabditis brenneri TaxID=135651 RepID=G0P760_CAEBE|nr:hypothetical protein CAEBREN_28848 [Caenorhabditis brenneri]
MVVYLLSTPMAPQEVRYRPLNNGEGEEDVECQKNLLEETEEEEAVDQKEEEGVEKVTERSGHWKYSDAASYALLVFLVYIVTFPLPLSAGLVRYISIGQPFPKNVTSFDKDPTYQIMKNQTFKYLSNIKYKLYILDAIPRTIAAAINKFGAFMKNGTDPVVLDKMFVDFTEYEMARKRHAQLAKDCGERCVLVDYVPEFYNNATKTFRYFDEKGFSYHTAISHMSPHADSCTRRTNTTILLAYSTDSLQSDVDYARRAIIGNIRSFYPYQKFANIRFDVKQEESIQYHSDLNSFNASVTARPADSTIGYGDKTTGSDVFNVVEVVNSGLAVLYRPYQFIAQNYVVFGEGRIEIPNFRIPCTTFYCQQTMSVITIQDHKLDTNYISLNYTISTLDGTHVFTGPDNGSGWPRFGSGIIAHPKLNGTVDYKLTIDYKFRTSQSQFIEVRMYSSYYHDFVPFNQQEEKCTRRTNSTVLFAYSTDSDQFDFVVAFNTFLNFAKPPQFHGYTTYANIRFDTRQEEEIQYHSDF